LFVAQHWLNVDDNRWRSQGVHWVHTYLQGENKNFGLNNFYWEGRVGVSEWLIYQVSLYIEGDD